MKATNSFALITGASKGLGRCYAIDLASRGQNVLLVAKKNEHLPELSEYIIHNYNVKAHYFETDLTNLHSLKKMTDWVNNNYSLDILINNVGTGGTIKFEEASLDYINNIIQLNIRALSFITNKLLPNLLKSQGQSFILNVSSMAAFCPIGYKSIYAASKKFIHYFSMGLQQELKDSNILVSTVFPGPMPTNGEITERIKKQGLLGQLFLQSPENVAKISLDSLFNRKPFIIVGLLNKINWFLLKIIPKDLIVPIISNTFKRELTIKNISYETSITH